MGFVSLKEQELLNMEQISKISIPSPCNQSFDSFTTTKNGGFCSVCQKEVIDFRNKNDEEILHYFENTKSKTCGYFRKEQLKTYEAIEKDSNPVAKRKWKFGFASISVFSLLSFNNAYTQSKTEVPVQQNESKSFLAVEKEEDKIRVSGLVSDVNGPMPGVTVWLKDTNVQVSTGFDGTFVFPQPIVKGAIIVVSFMGMETQEIIVKQEKNTIVLRDLFPNNDLVMAGEVAVDKVYHSKTSFLQKLKQWFRNE